MSKQRPFVDEQGRFVLNVTSVHAAAQSMTAALDAWAEKGRTVKAVAISNKLDGAYEWMLRKLLQARTPAPRLVFHDGAKELAMLREGGVDE